MSQEHIRGYRELSETEIRLINHAKQLGSEVGNFVENLKIMRLANSLQLDHVWLNEARMELKKGFMFLVRAVAKPEGF